MSKIIPIKDLRNTNDISKKCKQTNEPIFVTKNGYEDMVIMSNECFENITSAAKNTQNLGKPIFSEFKRLPQSETQGFVKVAASTIKLKVGNVQHNVDQIKEVITSCLSKQVKVLVFQELGLCGYTANDLLLNQDLMRACEKGLLELKEFSKDKQILFVVGAPLRYRSKLFNCAVVINNGKLLGAVPKSYIPNYNEFYEKRYFVDALENNDYIEIGDERIPFGKKLVFQDLNYLKLRIGIEICEDIWAVEPPSINLVKNGANLILNLSASNELIGKDIHRRTLISASSSRYFCGYVYACSGDGESSTDLIFGGHNIIAENGKILAESELFDNKTIISDIDLEKLELERLENTSFIDRRNNCDYVYFEMPLENSPLDRQISTSPFSTSDAKERERRNKEITLMQAKSLIQRMEAIHCKKVVLGFSGGLDSTNALIVCYEAFKLLNYPFEDINVYTLPSFGTSKRTYNNAQALSNALGVTFKEINISNAVTQHFGDINHDPNNQNVVFENAQARERTQILLDISNEIGGIMVGTGDLSEACLGFTTYNGDHMSSYGVNASLPKTLMQDLIKDYANAHENLKEVLYSILETPISPELLPPKDGEIAQKTEDNLGPYEIHDFFIYYFLRYNFSISKIYYLACNAFKDKYDRQFIKKVLGVFVRKFFNNQFKRSCIPDCIKIGSVSISPRGDLRLASDANSELYLKEVEKLEA